MDNPDDPIGDMKVNDIYIEIKHPNSSGQLEKLMRKFNKHMRNNNSYGFFVVGIEDMFNMGDVFRFNDMDDFLEWDSLKKMEMEEFGEYEIIPTSKKFPRIIGLIQTSTKIYIIGDESKLVRYGNSVLLVRDEISTTDQVNAEVLAKVFNPDPTKIQC